MNIDIIREDSQSKAKVFQVFQIYDRWSAKEMKIWPCLGLSTEVQGIGVQKCFGMACCFWNRKANSWSVNGES